MRAVAISLDVGEEVKYIDGYVNELKLQLSLFLFPSVSNTEFTI